MSPSWLTSVSAFKKFKCKIGFLKKVLTNSLVVNDNFKLTGLHYVHIFRNNNMPDIQCVLQKAFGYYTGHKLVKTGH